MKVVTVARWKYSFNNQSEVLNKPKTPFVIITVVVWWLRLIQAHRLNAVKDVEDNQTDQFCMMLKTIKQTSFIQW